MSSSIPSMPAALPTLKIINCKNLQFAHLDVAVEKKSISRLTLTRQPIRFNGSCDANWRKNRKSLKCDIFWKLVIDRNLKKSYRSHLSGRWKSGWRWCHDSGSGLAGAWSRRSQNGGWGRAKSVDVGDDAADDDVDQKKLVGVNLEGKAGWWVAHFTGP